MANLLCILLFVVTVTLLTGSSTPIGLGIVKIPEATEIDPSKTIDPKRTESVPGGVNTGVVDDVAGGVGTGVVNGVAGGVGTGVVDGVARHSVHGAHRAAISGVAEGILSGGGTGIFGSIGTGVLDGAGGIFGALGNSSGLPGVPALSMINNLKNLQARCDKLRFLPGCITMDVFKAIAGNNLPG